MRQSCFSDLPSDIHAEDPFTGEAHLSQENLALKIGLVDRSHLQWEQVDKASVQHVNGDGRLVGFSLPWLKMMTLISEREDAGCIKKW
jgi:hypothetical protein